MLLSVLILPLMTPRLSCSRVFIVNFEYLQQNIQATLWHKYRTWNTCSSLRYIFQRDFKGWFVVYLKWHDGTYTRNIVKWKYCFIYKIFLVFHVDLHCKIMENTTYLWKLWRILRTYEIMENTTYLWKLWRIRRTYVPMKVTIKQTPEK